MSNRNLLAYGDLEQNTTERVANTAFTANGTITYGQFADGTYGVEFDSGERLRRVLPAAIATLNYGSLSCRFKTLIDMVPANNEKYVLARCVNRSATANYVSLEFNYSTVDNVHGLNVLFGSAISGSASLVRIELPGISFLQGEEHHVQAFWFADPANPTGDLSVFIAIDGCILPTESNQTGDTAVIAIDTFLPEGVDALDVGNQSAVLNKPAQCIIQDVAFFGSATPQHWNPGEVYKLGRSRFDPLAVTHETIYQPTYKALGYSKITYDPIVNAKHWHDDGSTLGVLFATIDAVPRDEVWYSLDEGATWTKLCDDPSESGETIYSFWVHGGFMFCSIRSELYRAPYTLGTPVWTSILQFTNQPGAQVGHQITGFWNHTTYLNNLVVAEYEAVTAGGAKVYHSIDYGTTWTTRDTLPTGANPSVNRQHVHAVRYDDNGRLWMTTGDWTDVIKYSDDHGATWTAIVGLADHSLNTDFQVVSIEFLPERGLIAFAADTAFVPAQIAIYDDNGVDLHPYIHGNAWSKRMRLACIVGHPYNSNCFAVHRLPNRNFILSTNNENSGTPAVYIASPDFGAWVKVEDISGNQWWGFTESPNFVHGSKYRFPKSMRVIRVDQPDDYVVASDVLARATLSSGDPGTVASESAEIIATWKADPDLGTTGLIADAALAASQTTQAQLKAAARSAIAGRHINTGSGPNYEDRNITDIP